jgi:hypothetical protein
VVQHRRKKGALGELNGSEKVSPTIKSGKMALPDAEAIRKVTDVARLQEACLSLIQVCEKERESKRQYRQSASICQQEQQALVLELQCLREKNAALISCLENPTGSHDAQIESMKKENAALAAEIECLKAQLSSPVEGIGNESYQSREIAELKHGIEAKDTEIAELTAEKQELVNILETNKLTAKERIEKLKQNVAELTETLRAEGQKLQAQIEENENNAVLRKKTKEASKAKIAKIRAQKVALEQRIESYVIEIESQKQRIEELEVRAKACDAENVFMVHKIAELQKQLSDIGEARDLTANLSATIQKLNVELLELREKQKEETDFQNLLAERDATTAKLRGQIQSLLKQDSERSATIQELRLEICELNEKIAQLSSGIAQTSADDHAEADRGLLETRLWDSQATEELVRKNQKLTEMLEDSNRLYVQLKQEYTDLLHGSGARELSTHTAIIFDSVPSRRRRSSVATDMAQSAYLRRVLLQFFSAEQRTRASLVPVILALVGCDPPQISAALRHWERGSQLFSGLFGW